MAEPSAPVCLGTGYMTVPPRWQAPRHSHAFTEIIVLVRGRLTVRILGRDFVAAAGDVLAYPPGADHFEWTGPQTPSAFYLLAAVAPDWQPLGVLTQDTGSRVTHLAKWMYESRGHVHDDRKRISSAYLHALLGELMLQAKTGGKNGGPSPLELVRQHLQEHLGEHHDTAALAARAGLSRFHFIRAYKAYAGHTPMEDLRKLRIEAACGLLLTTTLPLKVIARKVGFCDEFHFAKAFKAEMAIPPGTYRGLRTHAPALIK